MMSECNKQNTFLRFYVMFMLCNKRKTNEYVSMYMHSKCIKELEFKTVFRNLVW